MYITAHNSLSSKTTQHVWVGKCKGIDLPRSGRTSRREADKIGRVSAWFAANVVETIVFCRPCHLTPSRTPYPLTPPCDEAIEVCLLQFSGFYSAHVPSVGTARVFFFIFHFSLASNSSSRHLLFLCLLLSCVSLT